MISDDFATGGKNSKKRTGGIFLGLAVFFFILAATTAYFYFNESQKVAEIEKLKKEQEQVFKKQFEESEKARKELQASFDECDKQISELNAEIRAQARKIRSLMWKGSQYSRIKQEFNELNKKYAAQFKKTNYVSGSLQLEKPNYRLDSLEIVANKYAERYISDSLQLEKVNHRLDSLEIVANRYAERYSYGMAQTQELLDKIRKHEKKIQELEGRDPVTKTKETYVKDNGVSTPPNFKATAFDVKTFYGKKNREEKETKDKNKLNIIRIMFNLSGSVPQNSFKDIIFAAIIKDPKGNVVVKSTSTSTILVDKTEEKISMRVEKRYRVPRKIFLSFSITDKKVTKLTKGAYTVEVYISENNKNFHELSSGGFNIK